MLIPRIIVDVTEEPITLARARLQCRVDAFGSPLEHADDELISDLIVTARQWAEGFTGRSLAIKTLEVALDYLPTVAPTSWPWNIYPTYIGAIELPGGPVVSLVNVTYPNDAESPTEQVVDATLDTYSVPNRVIPAGGVNWPLLTAAPNLVRIRYVAGYTPDALPKQIKQAMLLCIGHWYDNREDTSIVKLENIPLGAKDLLRRYRIEKAMA